MSRWFPMVLAVALLGGCPSKKRGPLHRDRAKERDSECTDAARPSAFFYPAKNRTDYAPDHPDRDGCQVLVPDHLFCCPDVPRATDR